MCVCEQEGGEEEPAFPSTRGGGHGGGRGQLSFGEICRPANFVKKRLNIILQMCYLKFSFIRLVKNILSCILEFFI